MEQSPEIRTCRASCMSTMKQSSNFAVISKSLTISQSQGKTLQRYFYRRESTNDKVEPIPIRKIKIEKGSSFHDHSYVSRSAKNTLITNGNEDSREIQLIDPLIFKDDKVSQHSQQLKRQHESVKFEERTRKIFRKTSDWTVMNHKISHLFAKSRKLQSSQFKIKINPRLFKEKSTIVSNMDLVIKKHKADNVKQIQQKMRSVMSRGGLNDSQKVVSMKEYNKKCGYSEDSLIFIWNSEDEHLRRLLLSWGWIQNNSTQSPFFHLKWTYMPNFTESLVKEKQLVNHFKNTHEITSKSYLTKNLKNNQSSFGKLNKYYPKCFDVGNQSQWMVFIEQYRHNVMLILLKKLYQLCVQKRSKQMLNYDLFYSYHFSRNPYSALPHTKKHKSVLRNKRFRQTQLEDFRKRSVDFQVQVNIVIEVLRYWRNFRKQKSQYEDNSYHFFEFNQFKFLDSFPELQKYALFNDLCVPRLEANFTKQMYSTPSELLLERISKEYQFCKHADSLFQTYGLNNIWIVKPTSNSRGSGIYLTTDLYEIQSSTKGIQSRLVQKYIERPLIIKNKKWSELYMKKFDLRQWVLLKSIDPIQIYIFSECYLRLCFDSYKVEELNQLYRHLTNYSINKQKFKNKQESVLPLSYLTHVLKNQYNVDWYKDIRPQIQAIIVKSIRSCVENMEDCGGNCFELFGYDILIDEQFRPWLLEINMSPACEERTPWLTQYLQDMGKGLLKYILPQEFLPQNSEEESNYKWELVLKEEAFFNRKKDVEQGLQIVGTSVKLNFEKDVDQHLIENKNAIKIQNFFKKYLPLYKKYKQEKLNKEKLIRDYLNSFKSLLQFKEKSKAAYITKLNKYLISTLSQIKCKSLIKDHQSRTISKFVKTFLAAKNYQTDLQNFRRQVFIGLAKSLMLKKKLLVFCSEVRSANKNVTLVQQKIRSFINFRKSKRRELQKYFKVILQLKAIEIKKIEIEKQLNTKQLQKYFKPILLAKKTQKSIQISKKQLICRYLGSLWGRKQFYSKKILIFLSLVGRVERVTKRRTRCTHFKTILEGWKSELIKQRQKAMEIQAERIKKIVQMNKQKNLHGGQLLGRGHKAGSIRPNKK